MTYLPIVERNVPPSTNREARPVFVDVTFVRVVSAAAFALFGLGSPTTFRWS